MSLEINDVRIRVYVCKCLYVILMKYQGTVFRSHVDDYFRGKIQGGPFNN